MADTAERTVRINLYLRYSSLGADGPTEAVKEREALILGLVLCGPGESAKRLHTESEEGYHDEERMVHWLAEQKETRRAETRRESEDEHEPAQVRW